MVLAALIPTFLFPTEAGASPPTPLTARFVRLGYERVQGAVQISGQSIDAGDFLWRVADQVTVRAFSLDITSPIDESNPLSAGDQASSSIPGIQFASWLVQHNAVVDNTSVPADLAHPRVGTQLPGTSAEAAAMQAAIWSFTNGLPLTSDVIPNSDVLNRAFELRNSALAAKDAAYSLDRYALGLDVEEVQGDLQHVSVRVNLSSDDPNKHLNKPECLGVRLAGRFGWVQTGITNHIGQGHREGKTDELKVTPAVDVTCPPLTKAGDFDSALIELPRSRFSRQLNISWPVNLNPGLTLFPSGKGAPMITANYGLVRLTKDVELVPPGISSVRTLFEQYVVALISLPGLLGFAAFLGLLAIAFVVVKSVNALIEAIFSWIGEKWRNGKDNGSNEKGGRPPVVPSSAGVVPAAVAAGADDPPGARGASEAGDQDNASP